MEAALIASLIMSLVGQGINLASTANTNSQNMDFTREMYGKSYQDQLPETQVANLKKAGLNPALAYGSIGNAQGQLISGNAQAPQLNTSSLNESLFKSPFYREQKESLRLDNEYKSAVTQYWLAKAKSEATMSVFDAEHQQERYNLDIEGKGLQNEIMRVQKFGYQYDNVAKRLQNQLHELDIEFNRARNSYAYGQFEADLNKTVAEVNKLISDARLNSAQAWQIRYLTPSQKSLIASQISLNYRSQMLVQQQYKESKGRTKNLESVRKQVESSNEAQELQNAYFNYLTDGGKNFKRWNRREVWKLCSGAVSTAIGGAVLIGSKFINKAIVPPTVGTQYMYNDDFDSPFSHIQ